MKLAGRLILIGYKLLWSVMAPRDIAPILGISIPTLDLWALVAS